MKKIVLAAFLAALSLAAQAKDSNDTQAPLDVAKVISQTDVQQACGIVPVQMVYDDSHGERHTLEYQVWAPGCQGG
jgi:hypothetical protein